MAGAFGYDAHHFEISRAIGDRVLLPAIRDLAADGLIIADGFACRTQIRHFCPDRHPLHIAQVLNQPEATEGLSHTVGASADGSSRP
jgi:hypothetical protein